jgi:hypothetical protein
MRLDTHFSSRKPRENPVKRANHPFAANLPLNSTAELVHYQGFMQTLCRCFVYISSGQERASEKMPVW